MNSEYVPIEAYKSLVYIYERGELIKNNTHTRSSIPLFFLHIYMNVSSVDPEKELIIAGSDFSAYT